MAEAVVSRWSPADARLRRTHGQQLRLCAVDDVTEHDAWVFRLSTDKHVQQLERDAAGADAVSAPRGLVVLGLVRVYTPEQ